MDEIRHLAERIRDVPASCTCMWKWYPPESRWARRLGDQACKWHTRKVKP
jgi:hypothetical protein